MKKPTHAAQFAATATAAVVLVACSTNQSGSEAGTGTTPQQQARKCAPRVYPHSARFMGAYGTTTVLAEVASDGRVTNAVVTKSSGNSDAHKDLDRATLDYIRSCVFGSKPSHAFDRRPVSIHWILVPGD